MAQLTNAIGGTVKMVSWDTMIEMVGKDLRTRLADRAAREGVDGVVAFEVLQLDSSALGNRQFAVFGPSCSCITAQELVEKRLRVVPSCFAYAVACWHRQRT